MPVRVYMDAKGVFMGRKREGATDREGRVGEKLRLQEGKANGKGGRREQVSADQWKEQVYRWGWMDAAGKGGGDKPARMGMDRFCTMKEHLLDKRTQHVLSLLIKVHTWNVNSGTLLWNVSLIVYSRSESCRS